MGRRRGGENFLVAGRKDRWERDEEKGFKRQKTQWSALLPCKKNSEREKEEEKL